MQHYAPHYALQLVTAPVNEAVSIAEAQDHLRVSQTDDCALIAALITAARKKVEADSSVLLVTQTWKLLLDSFPRTIEIPYRPVKSVTSIKYIDEAGVQQTLNAAKYQVDVASFLARIMPAYGESWPSVRSQMNAVEVIFVAGFGASNEDVPAPMKQAILLMVGHLYENREGSVIGAGVGKVPMGYDALIGTEKVYRV